MPNWTSNIVRAEGDGHDLSERVEEIDEPICPMFVRPIPPDIQRASR